MKGDIQAAEVAEQPTAQLQQHLLADSPRGVEEGHPAQRLEGGRGPVDEGRAPVARVVARAFLDLDDLRAEVG